MEAPSQRIDAERRLHGIDHVSIPVREYRVAKRFYELALRPLGFSVVLDLPARRRAYLGLPTEGSSVWLVEASYGGPTSISLAADDRSAVDAFYAAALAAGGRPLSPPDFHPEYTPQTYAAEVVDPDGNFVEAICRHAHAPTAAIEHAA